MFVINEDLSIYVTRGDVIFFSVTAQENGLPYKFQPNDVVRIKVFQKKNSKEVKLQKDFLVDVETERVDILLTEQDTKFGDVISKPTDFWYEIELNPFTNPQTIIGYDEEGPKIFKLFPEGRDITEDIAQENIPAVDAELSLTSTRPVQNQAIARGMTKLEIDFKEVASKVNDLNDRVDYYKYLYTLCKMLEAKPKYIIHDGKDITESEPIILDEGEFTLNDYDLIAVRYHYTDGDIRGMAVGYGERIEEGSPKKFDFITPYGYFNVSYSNGTVTLNANDSRSDIAITAIIGIV